MAARRVAADLELARSLARTSSSSVAVAFWPTKNFYQIEGATDLLNKGGPYEVHLGRVPYHAVLLSADFGGAGNKSVTFSGHGMASGEGTVVVQSGQYKKTVTLDPYTGNTQVE
jgi:hypothetical protein